MAFVLADRVKETTTTTGTGTVNLDGAATNYQTFVSGIGTGNQCYYAIIDNTNNAWEVGIGTVTDASPDTLSRDVIKASSNSGNVVTLASGTKDVFCTIPGKMPTAPVFVQAGTAATGTGAVTPTIPTNVANDIILVFAQSANQAITMTTGGYTQIGPQPGNGTAAAAAANRLAVFWKRSAGAEGNPTVADSGDHTTANCIVIRGCITTGDPFQFLSAGPKTTASTTLTATGGITTIDNMLVVVIAAQSVASNSAQFSGWTNSSLVSITEASDDSGTGGTGGGGVASAYGVKAVAGSVSSTTATEANSTVDAFCSIAMIPALFNTNSSPSPVWVFEYLNPSGTDIAVIPTNAVGVDIVAIGGGGAGGSGIASTAAGGGGGSGGAWSRKYFKVSELTSPLQVTVGSGGVGGATKSLAVGSVVKNNNGSGNTIVSSGRGGLGIDATSGSGGNGTAGGSVGSMAAVGASGQGQGGAGAGTATGGTTGAAGGKADMGGGAGGGGKNVSNTTGVGGTSEYGGGGGGGGGVTTQGANGAVGGGGQIGGTGAATGNSATATGVWTLGGSGGGGGATGGGGNGSQPGGGGGGGGAAANNGGNGGDGAVVITFYF
jgi:hypothetical protein